MLPLRVIEARPEMLHHSVVAFVQGLNIFGNVFASLSVQGGSDSKSNFFVY